jgi:putative isomerase
MQHTVDGVWGHGQLLAFSGIDGPTAFDTGLCLRTCGPGTEVQVKLPGAARIAIDPAPPRRCSLGSDWFDLDVAAGRVRGCLLDAWHLLIEGPVAVDGSDARLAVTTNGARTLIAAAGRARPVLIASDLDAAIAARRWWSDAAAARLGLAARPAAMKALRQLKGQVYAPEGVFRRRWTTPDRWPHRGCWLWDSAFHAIGARHADPALARDAIEAVLDGQQPDGRVPIRTDPEGPQSAHFTQPPTLVLAAWAVMQSQPDPGWVRALLPRLEAYLAWDETNRDAGHGLPYWAIEGDRNCRSGESGLDNASRFDAATRMEAVDFASFLSLEWELLGRLHARLGDALAAERCQARHARLNGLIRTRLWDDATGIFRDHDLEHGGFCPVAAATAFLPLVCGAADATQAARLAGQLADPGTFGTPVPLPSVARNDPTYERDMWRGPVWVNLVWLVAHGFERYGHAAEATLLRQRMVAEIERWHASHGTLFEFFDADGEVPPDRLKRKGRLAPEVSFYHQCFHDYGWTGTLYLDMLLQRGPLLPAIGD